MKKKQHHRPNIILIVIDALRAKSLGCYGGKKNLSPHIDKVAEKGILFENTYSSWNTTDQSLTSILCGRYPRTHGIVHHGDKVTPQDISMFEKMNIKLSSQIFRKHGYKTLAVDWMGRWFKKGFDYYGYEIKRNLVEKIIYYTFTLPYLHVKYMLDNLSLLQIYSGKRRISLKSMVKGLKDVLKTFAFTFELARLQDSAFVTQVAQELINKHEGRNFFLFLHFWDTHTPYNCPHRFLKDKKIYDQKEMLLSKYHGAVQYVDQQIGKLVSFLESKGILDNTLLIITSDHGESLTEHDIFFDHHGLYEVTTHVPLIFHYPYYFSQPKRVQGYVQHVDLLPTLCEITGVDSGEVSFDGTTLLPLIEGEKTQIRDHVYHEESYVQRKIGLRKDRYKYIYAPDGVGWCKYCQTVHQGKEELYDLENDPEEKNNITHHKPKLASQMREELTHLIRKFNTKREKQIIKNQLTRINRSFSFNPPQLKRSEEGKTGGSMKKRKVVLKFPESFLTQIEERIKNSDFKSVEQYLTFIVEEMLKEEVDKEDKTGEDKKIKKKLRNLGYMD